MCFYLTLAILLSSPQQELASKAFDDVPQLKTLDHYRGEWDVEFTVDSMDKSEPAKSFRGTTSADWILQGRFLKQTGTYTLSDKDSLMITTIMTFDSQLNAYRYWYFLSTGESYESSGTWDDAKRTMTSTTRVESDQSTRFTTAVFDGNGIEKWTIESRDKDGKITGRIRGKNTRRK